MFTRTRLIDEPHDLLLPSKKYWTSSDYPVGTKFNWSPGFDDRHFPTKYSNITDVVGNFGHQNPTSHLSISSSMTGFVPWARNDLADLGSVLFEGIYFPLAPGLKDFSDWPWLTDISAATISDWSVEAFNKFHDQVPTTVSLANFVYELKDMKGMIPSIDRLHLAKSASNNFLGFEFGVQPFISDIKNIVDMSAAVDKRLQHLLKTQGKSTNLSFNRTVVFTDDARFNRSTSHPILNENGQYVEFRRLNGKADFHIGGKLFQDLSDLASSISKLKALAASGGFNHPARVIWNAIPYSFVVDWFFHVGKLLDSLTIQPFGGEYSVTDVEYSIKNEALYFATQKSINGTSRDNACAYPLGTVSVKSYIRRLGFPLSSLFLSDFSLSPTQLALAGAMIHQRS